MILDEGCAERRLAAAILKRAVLDARSSNGRAAHARRWLVGDDAGLLFDALGLHPDRVAGWLEELAPAAQDVLPGM
jgi:hypothetical protein